MRGRTETGWLTGWLLEWDAGPLQTGAPHGNLPARLSHTASGAQLSFVTHEKSDVGSPE